MSLGRLPAKKSGLCVLDWVNHFGPDGKVQQIYCIDLHPHQTRFATGGIDRQVKIWKNLIKTPIATLRAHEGTVLCVRWSNDGRMLASGSDDNKILIWTCSKVDKTDTFVDEDWGVHHRLTDHTADVVDLAWNHDGSLFSSSSTDSTVIIWNGKTFEKIHRLTHDSCVKGLSWDPRGEYLTTQSDDNSVRFWKVGNWEKPHAIIKSPFGASPLIFFARLSWASDGSFLIAPNATLKDRKGGVMIVRDEFSEQCAKPYLFGHAKDVKVASVSKIPLESKNFFVVLSSEGITSIWTAVGSIKKNEAPTFLEKMNTHFWDVSWCPKGPFFAGCAYDHVTMVDVHLYCPNQPPSPWRKLFDQVDISTPDSSPTTKKTEGSAWNPIQTVPAQNGNPQETKDPITGKRKIAPMLVTKAPNQEPETTNKEVPKPNDTSPPSGNQNRPKRLRLGELQTIVSYQPPPRTQASSSTPSSSSTSTSTSSSTFSSSALAISAAAMANSSTSSKPNSILPLKINSVTKSSGLSMQVENRSELKIDSKEDFRVQIENRVAVLHGLGGKILYKQGPNRILWKDVVPNEIEFVSTSPCFVAVATNKNEIFVYSLKGRRLFPCIQLDHRILSLESKMTYLMTLLSDLTVQVWDIEKEKCIVDVKFSLCDANEIALPAHVTSTGIPVVTLGNGSTYTYNSSMKIWNRITDDYLVALETNSSLNKQNLGPNSPLTWAQNLFVFNESSKKNFAALEAQTKKILIRGQLESQISSSLAIKSRPDYFLAIRSYVSYLVQEINQKKEEDDENRLRELFSELIGPAYHLTFNPNPHINQNPNSQWDPLILGYQKRKILADLLGTAPANPIIQEYRTRLREILQNEAEMSSRNL